METAAEMSKFGWIVLLISRISERCSREPEFQRSIPSKFYDVAFHNYVLLWIFPAVSRIRETRSGLALRNVCGLAGVCRESLQ
jgi:hypothetical protein